MVVDDLRDVRQEVWNVAHGARGFALNRTGERGSGRLSMHAYTEMLSKSIFCLAPAGGAPHHRTLRLHRTVPPPLYERSQSSQQGQ